MLWQSHCRPSSGYAGVDGRRSRTHSCEEAGQGRTSTRRRGRSPVVYKRIGQRRDIEGHRRSRITCRKRRDVRSNEVRPRCRGESIAPRRGTGYRLSYVRQRSYRSSGLKLERTSAGSGSRQRPAYDLSRILSVLEDS